MIVILVALPLLLWDKRGLAVCLIAVAVYAGVLLTATFNHGATSAWSRQHVAWDASLIVPLVFLAVAYNTDLSLGLCVVIGLAAGAVLVPVAVRVRGREMSA